MRKKAVAAGVIVIIGLIVLIVKQTRTKHDGSVITVSGNVEVTETDTGFKLPGRVERLLTDEGLRVREGDRLAVLDSREIRNQLAQSGAVLHESLSRLYEMRAGSRAQELEQAKASVQTAEAELIKAKKDYERYVVLYEKGAVSAEQRDAMKRARDVAVSQHRKALEALSLVWEGPRKEEIAAAESRVRQAEAGVKIAETRMEDTTLFSPISGRVLKKNVEVGEVVAAGIPVFTIGDLENPWIKVYVKEDKLGLVKLGQKAEVRVDSYPNKVYEGKVTFISSEAEFTPKNVQTQEERVKLVFGVKVSVKNIDDELKPGMPADVKILLK
ncbi:MAG: HlyD family efflux transporter periplasmic adaptor subunit [Nitrospirae bacterium]|nr:HlyD family efflux transporter periplasmic adaptor subunit [Nitrospirota bacterium]